MTRTAPHRTAADRTSPPWGARSVAGTWTRLVAADERTGTVDPATVEHLPDPVRRWLRHTVPDGAPVARTAVLTMHGQLRLGAWRPFSARQVLAPGRGFVWAATVRVGPVPVIGFDRYADREGELRWRLLGAVPLVQESGPDVSRSAAGRLAAETMLIPTAALDPSVTWDALDETTARAHVEVDGTTHDVDLTVDGAGRLVSVVLPRWGNPLGEPFGTYPFGAFFTGEQRCAGVLVPRHVEAGWFPGTERWVDGAFFRAELEDVVLRRVPSCGECPGPSAP